MNPFLNNLKRQAEENPLATIVIGIAVLSAARGVLMSGVAARNSHVWAKEVARRTAK